MLKEFGEKESTTNASSLTGEIGVGVYANAKLSNYKAEAKGGAKLGVGYEVKLEELKKITGTFSFKPLVLNFSVEVKKEEKPGPDYIYFKSTYEYEIWNAYQNKQTLFTLY